MKFEEGKLYRVTFHDHSIGFKGKMICEAVGWVLEDTKDHTTFTSWRVTNADEQVTKDNVEAFVIIKSCIIKARKFL